MTDSEPAQPKREAVDDPPPFLGAWAKVYLAVVIYLGFLIGAFYLFGAVFTP